MSLRTRTVTVVALAAIVAGTLAVVISREVVLGDFESLEADNARTDADRAADALRHDAAGLATVVADWAVWDDTYDYVREPSDEYEDSNLGAVTLEGLALDVFVIADSDGDLRWDGMLGEDGLEPVPAGLRDAVALGGALSTVAGPDDGRAGLLRVDGELMLVAAHAITDSEEVADPVGALVMGRWLDADEMGSLAERLRLEIELEPPSGAGEVTRTSSTITATIVLTDVVDRPAGTLAVTQSRDLMSRGVASVGTLVTALLATLMVGGVVLAFGLDRQVTRPLSRLRREVDSVAAAGGTGRVATDGKGEIADLAGQINDMLAGLERARQDLELRNRELQEANAIKEDLVSVVSHELKTPLTVILGFARTLSAHDDRLTPERRDEFVQRIAAQAERLGRLVDDLLILSRADRGELSPEPEPARLRAAIMEVVEDLRMVVDVEVTVADDVEAVVDPDHLRRILVNLLDNARKYGRPPVTVAAEVVGGSVRIEVGDAGDGVPEEFVDHLFQRFSQAEQSDRREQDGTGLGLSIVRDLCAANDGQISYRAGPDGHAFVVELPGRLRSSEDQPASTG